MKFIYTDFYRYFDEYKIQSVRCLNLLHLYKSVYVCYIIISVVGLMLPVFGATFSMFPM